MLRYPHGFRSLVHNPETTQGTLQISRPGQATLTKRTVDALEPQDKPWIAWDDRLTGFGVRVHPSGAKSYVVNYRAGNGGRKAPNKRVVVGRAGRVTPDQARRRAQELLGRVAAGEDPAGERAEAGGLPRLAGRRET